MSLEVTFNIKETDAQIANLIVNALKPEVEKILKKSFNKIKKSLKDIVQNALRLAPEYQSLVSGELRAEFGLPDGQSRADAIIALITKIGFEFKPIKHTGYNLSGSFILTMIESDFKSALSSPAATFTTEKGTQLDWLEWLLLLGNKTIIKDYVVDIGPNPRSRTGMAVMRGVKSGKWQVPSAFSGTINNNWITRSIDSVEQDIKQLIQESITL
jgi:hypothetical protein